MANKRATKQKRWEKRILLERKNKFSRQRKINLNKHFRINLEKDYKEITNDFFEESIKILKFALIEYDIDWKGTAFNAYDKNVFEKMFLCLQSILLLYNVWGFCFNSEFWLSNLTASLSMISLYRKIIFEFQWQIKYGLYHEDMFNVLNGLLIIFHGAIVLSGLLWRDISFACLVLGLQLSIAVGLKLFMVPKEVNSKIIQVKHSGETSTCSICYEEINNATFFCSFSNHNFHKDCLMKSEKHGLVKCLLCFQNVSLPVPLYIDNYKFNVIFDDYLSTWIWALLFCSCTLLLLQFIKNHLYILLE